MYPTRFDPFAEFKDLERKLFNLTRRNDGESNISAFMPAVNTREGEYAYHVEVDLPGIKKEDIVVDVDGNTLTISGERKTRDEVKKEDYYKTESFFGRFQRSFTLPDNVDTEQITANANDGVLEVVIPKSEERQNVKKIAVS